MKSLAPRFDAGITFEAMLEVATANVELYRNLRLRTVVPPEYPARIAATRRRWHLLVISEDWCGDSVNIVPWIDALAAASPGTDVRIIGRDDNLDLMDLHLTDGRARAIPVVLLLDDGFVERAWWGPRSAPVQEWFVTPEAQALSKDERYKELRLRYARDRGRSILDEVTSLIEAAAVSDSPDVIHATSARSPTARAAS